MSLLTNLTMDTNQIRPSALLIEYALWHIHPIYPTTTSLLSLPTPPLPSWRKIR